MYTKKINLLVVRVEETRSITTSPAPDPFRTVALVAGAAPCKNEIDGSYTVQYCARLLRSGYCLLYLVENCSSRNHQKHIAHQMLQAVDVAADGESFVLTVLAVPAAAHVSH